MIKGYIVTYDLRVPGRDYTGLYNELKKTTYWWHYLESSWIISTTETPDQIWQRLQPHVDQSDFLLIIEVRDNCQGWLAPKAWEWIHAKIPKP